MRIDEIKSAAAGNGFHAPTVAAPIEVDTGSLWNLKFLLIYLSTDPTVSQSEFRYNTPNAIYEVIAHRRIYDDGPIVLCGTRDRKMEFLGPQSS